MNPATRLIVSLVALTLLAFHSRLAGQTTVTLTTLHNFTGTGPDGGSPTTKLVQGSDGNFYGTTGTSGNAGTVFRMTPAGMITTLHTFTDTNTDGAFPNGLVQGSDGNFYGTTYNGGDSVEGAGGTAYRITPAGVATLLHSFTGDGTDGSNPDAALIQGSDGNFYSTTQGGGSGGFGTVFRMTPAGMVTTLHGFSQDDPAGDQPSAALVQGSDGNLYGTTLEAVFRINLAGTLITLHRFTGGLDGVEPEAGLVQGRDGNFYGTTMGDVNFGGSDFGTVYQITPAGVLTTLHQFGNGTGASPVCDLARDGDGSFYGTTQGGGSYNKGTIFQITSAGVFNTLYSFGGGDGATPVCGLVQGSDGSFYGTASQGGSNAYGTVFKLTVPPAIISPTSASGTVGAGFSYQIVAANGATSYAASGLPPGLDLEETSGLISGTPTTAGTYMVTIAAFNSVGRGAATLTLTIDPLTPVINSAAPPAGQVGVAYNFQLTATKNPTSFAASGLPPGLAIDTASGQISGTPSQAGTFPVSFTATNTAGTGSSASYSLTILPAAPVITSPGGAGGQVGQPFSYQITATNGPTSFNVQGLTDGLTVNGSTGLITGTPTAAESFNLTLNASNSGGTGSATLTVTISASASAAPVITSAASASGQANQSFDYQITATNSPTSFGASGLPAGLSINTTTGLISGTPTAASTPTVAITASNAGGTGSATLTLNITAAPADITSFNFASPPAQSQLVSGNTILVYLQVLYSGTDTLQSLELFADDTTTGVSTPLSEADDVNINEFAFTWTPPAPSSASTADDYTLRAEATDSSGATETFKLFVTVVSSSTNLVSSIQLLPDVSGKHFIPGSNVTLSPVTDADTANRPIKRVAVYDPDGNTVAGGVAMAPQFTGPTLPGNKLRVFPPINYPVRPAVVALTATVTNANNCSNPSAAVSLNPSTAQVDLSSLACAITAPAADANGAATVPANTSFTVTASAKPKNGSDAVSVEYYVDGALAGSSTSAPFSVTVPALAAGQHTLTAIATDTSLNVSRQAAPIALTAEAAPAITSATTAAATTGVAFTYHIAASNSPTSFGVQGLPAGLAVNASTGLISGTPKNAGTFQLTLNAYNAAGKGTATLTLTVAQGIPVITSATTATATEGQAFSYQITASGNPTSYGVQGLPAGITVNATSGLLTGTPKASGTFTLTLNAYNRTGKGSATLKLSVAAAAPAITSATTASGTVGQAFTYQITATNGPTSYGVQGLPGGLAVNASTGAVTGTPKTVGTYTLTLNAYNSVGKGSATLTLTVKGS